MFNLQNVEISEALDARITELLNELSKVQGEEYTKITINLAKLMELRNNALKTQNENIKIENERFLRQSELDITEEKVQIDKDRIDLDRTKFSLDEEKLNLDKNKFEADEEHRRSWKPSSDAIVGAAASVIGILLILNYEKLGVVTSKALGFINRR